MTTISMVVAMVAGTASVQMDRQSAQAAGFEARHSQRNLTAGARGLTGSAQLLPDGTLQAQLTAKVDSFRFGDASSDKYVREALNVKKYPFIQVNVRAPAQNRYAQPAGDQVALATGTVTMRGVTRPVQILLHVSAGAGTTSNVSGELPLDLKDFGVPALTLISFPIDSKIQMHFDVAGTQDISTTPAIATASVASTND
jgi:polyisoprenoid-binding protein YceI